MIIDFIAVLVGKCECVWHSLGPAQLHPSLYHISRHGLAHPMMAGDAGAGCQAHKPMAALIVPSWAETDSTHDSFLHFICVFFMSLNVFSKFQAYMKIVVEFLTGH